MIARAWIVGLGLLVAFASCSPPERGVRVAGTTTASLAVGTKYRFAVIDDCDYPGPGFIILSPSFPLIIPTPPTCLTTTVDSIRSITFTDPSVVQVTQQAVDHGGALFEIAAVAAGTTQFKVTISTAEGLEYSASGEFTVEVAASVSMTAVCDFEAPGAVGDIVPVGRAARYRPGLVNADGDYLDGFGYLPIEVDGAPIVLDEQGFFAPPTATPGQVTVTTPIDPDYHKVIEVLPLSAATAIDITAPLTNLELTAGDLTLTAATMYGARSSCFGRYARRVVAETPAACGLLSGTATDPIVAELPSTDERFTAVRGLAIGSACTVRMELIGGTATGTITLPVHEGWVKMTPPVDFGIIHGVSLGPDRVVLVGAGRVRVGDTWIWTAATADWNGAAWTMVSPTLPLDATNQSYLNGVAVSGSTVFAVGSRGAILSRTGAGPWVLAPPVTTANLQAVYALSSTEAIAVGDAGTVVRFTGGSWRLVDAGVPATVTANAAWGSGPSDLWVAADLGVLRHFDGVSWSAVEVGDLVPPTFSWKAVWGLGANDVYAGGIAVPGSALLRWDGVAWRRVLAETTYDVWGSGPDDIYATGKLGFGELSHWDGRAWASRNMAENFTMDVWGWTTREVYVHAYVNDLFRYR